MPREACEVDGSLSGGVSAGTVRSAFVASTVTVGPSNADWLLQLSMMSARKRLWIANAYFLRSDNLVEALEHHP